MKEKVNMQKEKSVIKQNKNYYVININNERTTIINQKGYNRTSYL